MNYRESIEYLFGLGNEIQTMKFGLETTTAILDELGRPQDDFSAVIVAGTNGKGSVASFIHSALLENGLETGLFTSPHLERIEERITTNGQQIDSEIFADQFTAVLEASMSLGLPSHPTFFELIACTALYAFSRLGMETAVLEVGMGGRLDSTNTVEPVLSVITRIGLDHQQYLGATLALIAAEKAGIMRGGVSAVSSPQAPEALAALEKAALEVGAPLDFLTPDEYQVTGNREGCYRFHYRGREYRLGVPGIHQAENAAVALKALDALRRRGWEMTPEAVQAGIEKMTRPGVVEVIKGQPDIILDGCHNRDAALSLRRFLESHAKGPLTLIFGMMKDKDIEAVASILSPLFAKVVLVSIKSSRACSIGELKKYVPDGIGSDCAADALDKAVSAGNTVVVAGSLYLVGELRPMIRAQGEGVGSSDQGRV